MWKYLMAVSNRLSRAPFRALASWMLPLVLAVLLGGCVAPPPAAPSVAGSEDVGSQSILAYYQSLLRMTPAQIARERQVLAALPPTANTQVRIAMVLGHPRGQPDLARALTLLEGVLKSNDPGAVGLHPLARLLADNYGERQKLEGQLEKQGHIGIC